MAELKSDSEFCGEKFQSQIGNHMSKIRRYARNLRAYFSSNLTLIIEISLPKFVAELVCERSELESEILES